MKIVIRKQKLADLFERILARHYNLGCDVVPLFGHGHGHRTGLLGELQRVALA